MAYDGERTGARPRRANVMTMDKAMPTKGDDHRWIFDWRGRLVRPIDPMKLQLLHQNDVIDRATLDRMLDDLEPGLARRLKWFLLPLIVAAGVTAATFALLWAISDQNFRAALVRVFTRNPMIYLPILVSVVIAPLATARKHRRDVPDLMLKNRRCPHCAYDLQGLPTDEEDGATICPECACAWDLEDASAAGQEVTDPAPVATPMPVKVGIAGAVLLGAVVIAVILFGPVSRSGAGMVATSLMVTGVIVVMGLIVTTLAIWKRGFGRR
jgi:hypothetical protein